MDNVTQISPQSLFLSIAHHLPDGRKCFPYDDKRLNAFFYEQKQKHPDLLGEIRFEWDASYPKSREIINAIRNMTATGLINIQLPRFIDHYFNPDCEIIYNNRISRGSIPADILSELEEIAAEFNEKIAIDQKIKTT